MLVPLGMALLHCERVGRLDGGRYAVADREYSEQDYVIERSLGTGGRFEERHLVERCLLMEMTGAWIQDGGRLELRYDRSRLRESCRDSLPAWTADSSRLEIPIRNVESGGYESLLAAAEGKPEKWIRWNRQD
jgi:hypothetical protein